MGDPLALYRCSKEAQLAVLGLRWFEHEQRTRPERKTPAPPPVAQQDPDPNHGRTLPRPPWLQAVNSEARERADRFRVA
jgi:hypothetical protein